MATVPKRTESSDDNEDDANEERDIRFNELIALMPNSTISDIRLIKRLNECGEETIEKIKPFIKYIHISEVNLVEDDQILLAAMIKRCSPLRGVYIQELRLNPPLLKGLSGSNEHVTKYQVGYEIEDSITSLHVPDVIQLLKSTEPLYVVLHCNDDVKTELLTHWMSRNKLPFDGIGLINVNSADTLGLLFQLLGKFRFTQLSLGLGEDISEKISSGDICLPNTTVDAFKICDKSLTPEKIEAYLKLLQLFSSKTLCIERCNLTVTDVTNIKNACTMYSIELTDIKFWSTWMPPSGFKEVAAAVSVTKCKTFLLCDCNLNKNKLSEFAGGCKEENVVKNQQQKQTMT